MIFPDDIVLHPLASVIDILYVPAQRSVFMESVYPPVFQVNVYGEFSPFTDTPNIPLQIFGSQDELSPLVVVLIVRGSGSVILIVN